MKLYDAPKQNGAPDPGARQAFVTLRVQSVEERAEVRKWKEGAEDGKGETRAIKIEDDSDEEDQKGVGVGAEEAAVARDEANVVTLVKNLASTGTVRPSSFLSLFLIMLLHSMD